MLFRPSSNKSAGRTASPCRAARLQSGFTLIELMVGIVIGLLTTLAVTQVMVRAEGYKRTTTSGADAQINGALALATLQRAIMPAGYGFAAVPASLGCPLSANFNGAAIAGFPANLAPLVITQGAGGAADSIRVLASGKSSYSLPIPVTAPGYVPTDPALNAGFLVSSVRSVQGPAVDASGNPLSGGDLMVALTDATVACEVFRVSANPGVNPVVARSDDLKWNAAGFPTRTYTDGSYLINMGPFIDQTYSIGTATSSLQMTALNVAADSTPSYVGPTEIFPNIVNFKAIYGKDTNADSVVDTWDNATPTTNAGWRQVLAVRLAIVARSDQYEKEEVTLANPVWDVGTAVAVVGTSACGTSQCLTLKVDFAYATDWKHYRYKIFDTVVPLRNMLWSS